MKTKYAVIANLEESSPFYDMDNLPLHITLVGIFDSTKSPDYFITIIKNVASRHNTFKLNVIGQEDFGNNGNRIVVTELDKNAYISNLHQDLIDSFKSELGSMNPNFMPGTYRPHVTDQRNKTIKDLDTVELNNLTLLEIKDSMAIELFRIELS